MQFSPVVCAYDGELWDDSVELQNWSDIVARARLRGQKKGKESVLHTLKSMFSRKSEVQEGISYFFSLSFVHLKLFFL